jgi:hypothetical protein
MGRAPIPFVVVGNPDSKRVAGFAAAVVRAGHPPILLVPYADLLAGRADLATLVPPGAVVRIESPDRDWEVERAILALGAEVPDEDGDYARASAAEVAALAFDKGAFGWPRQWYLGYCRVLARFDRALAAAPPHWLMQHPTDIATMFDKRACHTLLQAAGVSVPVSLEPIQGYVDLRAKMRTAGWRRVFVKPAHGSSASGVVAYQTSGDRHQATTTVEMVPAGDGVRLYNSRRLHTYRSETEIATLIDALARHRVHVEQWWPKAGLAGQTCDLRVLMIGGRVRHVVVRLSRSPLTNLHLSNDRATLDLLRPRLAPGAWDAAAATCERVMALFPRSLYAGIDLMFGTDYRQHALAEVNAFGDLLYDTWLDGQDPYDAEIAALEREPAHA